LREYWIRVSPEVITLNDPGGRSVMLYQEAVIQFQRDLQRFGARITLDGDYGNQTGSAVRALNDARNSAPWLTPDGEFLYSLTRP
jgi:peptidoglycan hydrolase-like protein with peptidoglycan-binding domain